MRYTTRHKTWGRAQLCQNIQSVLHVLTDANAALAENRMDAVCNLLQVAIDGVKAAAKAMDIYKVPRGRLKKALEREVKVLDALLKEAKAIPITQEEKIQAKVEKKRGEKS